MLFLTLSQKFRKQVGYVESANEKGMKVAERGGREEEICASSTPPNCRTPPHPLETPVALPTTARTHQVCETIHLSAETKHDK